MDARSSYVEIRENPLEDLSHYLEIQSRFEARSVFDVYQNIEGFSLVERDIPRTYSKNYDVIEDPRRWLEEFDVSNWAMISAFRDGKRVGGAIAAFNSPGVELLEGRNDLVVIWDIRVAPTASRTGVGGALADHIEGWARIRRCCEVKVETQNTNVAACRFYQSRGFRISEANYEAYPNLPEDIQLIWRKSVAG